ncbi:hypothetical protein D3C87_1162750 [compost metagenome]
MHVARGTRGAVGQVVTAGVLGRVFDIEGTEHRGFSATWGFVIVHRDSEHGEA